MVHSGKFHILSCQNTVVVLDGSNGMSIYMIGQSTGVEKKIDTSGAVLMYAGLHAVIRSGGHSIELDQAFDSAARIQIIDQGPGRVAARAYFSMMSQDGIPHGSGTLDVYVYSERVFLVPSLFLDYESGGGTIVSAGLKGAVPGSNAELLLKGSQVIPKENVRFEPFGDDPNGFNILLNNSERFSTKIGWLRGQYPTYLYLNEIDKNPETDELYEKWPAWISQRGNPLSWKRSAGSGMLAHYSASGVQGLDFLWLNGDSLKVPEGSYTALNGIMAVFLGANSMKAEEDWKSHQNPIKPQVKNGEFKYYNEIEGVYEIDSKGRDTEVVFDNTSGNYDLPIYMRLWNLQGKSACGIKVNGEKASFALFNDGDRIEDPMVPMLKDTTGPARYGGVAFTAGKGIKTTVTLTRSPGMQFVYQMYSDLETYEAWTEACTAKPLFRFHVTTGEIYQATLPGKEDYAMAKLPLYWVRNGVNNDTFMNHTRGFSITENGPGSLQFIYTGVNMQGTGLSVYEVTAKYNPGRITFGIRADFTPLDDGKRWSSVEYCDLYPFDNVYRRTFHYRDVVFLNKDGVFDRVGTGAWSSRFKTVIENDRPSYYSTYGPREQGVSRCPDSADGTVWMLGSSPARGNILYRRGEWLPSVGAQSVFALCNAWVDIHNTVVGRKDLAAKEIIQFTVEVFAGPAPSLDTLNALYSKAAGGKAVKQVTAVNYSSAGEIVGFEVKK
ncbi:MAG: hypothetical protein Q8O92_07090 [Candidatus Latescibacter sp.]|nr:hypothetical protein [Candidatus Latescibacter sp.]